MLSLQFAARINSFLSEGSSLAAALKTIAAIDGVQFVDLNYPTHISATNVTEIKKILADSGISLNGIAIRFYDYPEFKTGAFTHHDAGRRQKAIDEAKKAIDAAHALGGKVMTIWPSQDGFRYPFQTDYSRAVDWEVEGLRAAAAHDPEVAVSIEYKPDEPRSSYFINNIGSTLLLLREANHPNLGITIDFCHSLYARENPAYALSLAARYGKLLGVHINDGYGYRDDGMPVGSVRLQQTLEFLYQALRVGYQGVYYFDTFPDGEKAADELAFNVRTTAKLLQLAGNALEDKKLDAIMANQDGIGAARYALDLLTR